MEFLRNSLDTVANMVGYNNEEANPNLVTGSKSGAVSASDLMLKKDLHDELLDTRSDNLHSVVPDTSAKAELHEELLNERQNVLHPVDNSAEKRLSTEKYQPIALESHPDLAYDAIPKSATEDVKSRPEFQRNPLIFTPAYQSSGSYEADREVPQTQSISQTNYSTSQPGLTSQRSFETSQPASFQTLQKDAVVHEHIHPIEKEEVQPVIYREREQLDLKQVTQMMHETQIQPTRVEARELPAQYRENVIQERAPIQENVVLPSREIDAASRSTIVHQPIVNEIVKKTVVEEIQPVVERDVYAPTVVRTQQPIYEKIVEAPIVTRQTVETRELGTHNSGYASQTGYPSQTGYASSTTYGNTEYPSETLALNGGYPSQTGQLSNSGYSSLSNSSNSQSSWNSNQQDLLISRGYPNLAQQQQLQSNILPTGQVLPAVASTRPAYSYLPRGAGDKQPDFIGTGSQYALAANGGVMPKSEFVNPLLPQGSNFFPNTAPQALRRQ